MNTESSPLSSILSKFFADLTYHFFPRKEKLVILDNYFPNRNCGFKMNEYNYLLDHFPGSEVYSTWPDFKEAAAEYYQRFPRFKGRVKKFTSKKLYFASLFYISFLHNTHSFLSFIEREQTPFVFSLYGGGFFGLHYPESDEKLRAVCKSPWLRKIIVSQTITQKYLVENGFVTADKVALVYGSTPSENQTSKRYLTVTKKKYPTHKKTFDVCFVARRHTPQGKDKGYHLFIAAAKKLATMIDDVHFHVAGDFDETIIPVKELKNKITFYGEIPIASLPDFFADKDIYLSPNIPNIIHQGSFEGITGTCQEAAIAGAAVFCCDVLKLNIYFTDKKDIIFIEPNAQDIVTKVLYYYKHLLELYTLSKNGKQKFLEVFDFDSHIQKKIAILSSVVAEDRL